MSNTMCVSIPEADPACVSFWDPARGLQDLQGHAEVSHIYSFSLC